MTVLQLYGKNVRVSHYNLILSPVFYRVAAMHFRTKQKANRGEKSSQHHCSLTGIWGFDLNNQPLDGETLWIFLFRGDKWRPQEKTDPKEILGGSSSSSTSMVVSMLLSCCFVLSPSCVVVYLCAVHTVDHQTEGALGDQEPQILANEGFGSRQACFPTVRLHNSINQTVSWRFKDNLE